MLIETEILKIGWALGTQWVAPSNRAVVATWNNYEALVKYFQEVKENASRNKTKEAIHVRRSSKNN